MLRFVALIALATQAFSADLEIRYSALERMVAAQMFTQEGRRYVRGNRTAKCQYAYLEAPKLSAANGRLQVTARFSGSSALDLFSRCVGMGDSFNLTVTALPVPRKGAIGFEDAQVSTPRRPFTTMWPGTIGFVKARWSVREERGVCFPNSTTSLNESSGICEMRNVPRRCSFATRTVSVTTCCRNCCAS